MTDTSLTYGDRAKVRWDKAKGKTLRRTKPIKPCPICGAPCTTFEERRGTEAHFLSECDNGHTFERFGKAADVATEDDGYEVAS